MKHLIALAALMAAVGAQAQTDPSSAGPANADTSPAPAPGTPGPGGIPRTGDGRVTPSSGMSNAPRGSNTGGGWWSQRGSEGWSLLPGTTRGYVGLSVGRPDYDLVCVSGFRCDDPNGGAKIYTGGLFNEWIGGEIGYVWLGRAEKGGGRTRADGVDLALVLRAPLGPVSVHGKLGAVYGRTRINADGGAPVVTGSRDGWGGMYGVGVGFDFARNSSIVLEWERREFTFPGTGDRDVDMASVGYVFRF